MFDTRSLWATHTLLQTMAAESFSAQFKFPTYRHLTPNNTTGKLKFLYYGTYIFFLRLKISSDEYLSKQCCIKAQTFFYRIYISIFCRNV